MVLVPRPEGERSQVQEIRIIANPEKLARV
jgi:hypothetical protein